MKRVVVLLVSLLALTLVACGGSGSVAPSAAGLAPINVAAGEKINLNDTSSDQLMATIPNFSSRMVREFLEYQPYVSIQEFRKEIGKYVSAEQVAEYERYVYVPVSANDADAETLKQLPGVDDSIAAELIAGRPYANNQAFLEALAQHVSADETSMAGQLLVTQ